GGGGSRGGGGGGGWPCPRHRERGRLAQLLRRATFGVTQEAMEQGLQDGFDSTVDRLMERSAEPAGLISPSDPAQGSKLALNDLQHGWLRQMLSTPPPFGERVTRFWPGPSTTEYQKRSAGAP